MQPADNNISRQNTDIHGSCIPPSTHAVSKTKRRRQRRHQKPNMVEVTVCVESKAINYYCIMEPTITVIVSSFLLLSAVVDSFRFGAVWILSTRRLSDVRVVFHCCGFFPFQSRVDSFHSAIQYFSFCLAPLQIRPGPRGRLAPSVESFCVSLGSLA